MANDFNSVLATCQRFQDIATWDPEHFNANGALARIAGLHKREIAEKDALIRELADALECAINGFSREVVTYGEAFALVKKAREVVK